MGLLVGLKQDGLVTAASIIVSALVLLVAGVWAAEETVTLGDYEVSFDLGNYTGYELDFEEVPYATVDGEEYNTQVCWIRGDGSMMIAINDYVVPMEANSSNTRKAVSTYLDNAECPKIHIYEEQIDSKPAILGLGERPSGDILVCAIYWPDIHDVNGTLYGQVDCTIASEASVELTEMLLNSIHVGLPGEEVIEVRSEADRIEL